MRKVKLVSEIEVEIGETEEDYCNEVSLPKYLKDYLEGYTESMECRYTCKFKITKVELEECINEDDLKVIFKSVIQDLEKLREKNPNLSESEIRDLYLKSLDEEG